MYKLKELDSVHSSYITTDGPEITLNINLNIELEYSNIHQIVFDIVQELYEHYYVSIKEKELLDKDVWIVQYNKISKEMVIDFDGKYAITDNGKLFNSLDLRPKEYTKTCISSSGDEREVIEKSCDAVFLTEIDAIKYVINNLNENKFLLLCNLLKEKGIV